MINDMLETKNNNWIPRRIVEGPKTIEAIHNEASGFVSMTPQAWLSPIKTRDKSGGLEEQKDSTPTTSISQLQPTQFKSPIIATRTVVSRRIIEQPKTKIETEPELFSEIIGDNIDVTEVTDSQNTDPLDIEKLERLYDELFITEDIYEAVTCFSELNNAQNHAHHVVVTGINLAVEKKRV